MNAYLAIAARGKTDWWRYPVAIAMAVVLWLALCEAAIVGPVIIALAMGHRPLITPDIGAELTEPSHFQVFYGGTGALFGTLILVFALAVRLLHAKRFGDITGEWRWRRFATGAAIWLAVCIVAGLVDYLIEPGGFRLTVSPATADLVFWAVPGLAIQTFAEEFIFRGYITQALLLATRRPLVTSASSGLAFAALHIPNGWPQAASALAFGAITAFIAIRTGGIAFTYGLHLVNNLFGAVVVVSAGDVFKGSPAILTQSTPNLMWLDAAVPFVALAAALAFVAFRGRLRASTEMV